MSRFVLPFFGMEGYDIGLVDTADTLQLVTVVSANKLPRTVNSW